MISCYEQFFSLSKHSLGTLKIRGSCLLSYLCLRVCSQLMSATEGGGGCLVNAGIGWQRGDEVSGKWWHWLTKGEGLIQMMTALKKHDLFQTDLKSFVNLMNHCNFLVFFWSLRLRVQGICWLDWRGEKRGLGKCWHQQTKWGGGSGKCWHWLTKGVGGSPPHFWLT
jgi:hypothetical protein